MIKIVEIKGGLKEYHEQKEFPFEDSGLYYGKSRRIDFSGLYEQLVFLQRVPIITREELEEAMSQVSPMTPTRSQTNLISDPVTGNTEVRHNGQDLSFSRDMTEEQIIAHFDSLN